MTTVQDSVIIEVQVSIDLIYTLTDNLFSIQIVSHDNKTLLKSLTHYENLSLQYSEFFEVLKIQKF